jgi:hypothetical protein
MQNSEALMDCSYPARQQENLVLLKYHQRSWWIVHTLPTSGRTWYFGNTTNEVGGSFIPHLQGLAPRTVRNPTNAVVVFPKHQGLPLVGKV